ncbi:VPDSG-CTERM sorting domain-containing protein [Pelagicoccus mobilis]|uniref:VPDSG-CTERM sorting domain-containing protein n=1 Tax=Pelagicoccus mobilis TaxID=415221 RepID=A0A934VT44_9BACT|nr:VPDSG-CTERM sorting domain-containing protein [Pelagicoccus mobilis]MBK1879323.1 VPDSG-CTERM sorting domain-containing protein [Pelagicoccus mobilis]
MKKILSLITVTIVLGISSSHAVTIYEEDFSDALGGWSTNYTGAGIFGIDGGAMAWLGKNVDQNPTQSSGTWFSPLINIAGFTDIKIFVDVWTKNDREFETNDYLSVGYDLDSNGITNITTFFGAIPDQTVMSSSLSGTSLKVAIEIFNTGTNEFTYFDNVKVTGTPVPDTSTTFSLLGLAIFGLAFYRNRK